MTALGTIGSGLNYRPRTDLDQPPPPHPQLPKVVVVTGTGLSSAALHLDAT